MAALASQKTIASFKLFVTYCQERLSRNFGNKLKYVSGDGRKANNSNLFIPESRSRANFS